MEIKKHGFEYEEYNSIEELNADDKALVEEARQATKNAFADFSKFRVGSAARVKGEKEIYIGSNQENGSYPVGICAERALLAAVASKFGSKKIIETIAVSYENMNDNKKSNAPLSPCGMCRQALSQYEDNTGKDIRLILSGKEGKIFIINTAKDLLPLAFTGKELK